MLTEKYYNIGCHKSATLDFFYLAKNILLRRISFFYLALIKVGTTLPHPDGPQFPVPNYIITFMI